MRKMSIILTVMFVFAMMGCVGLSGKTKALYPGPTNDVQKLANYVVERGKHYFGSDYNGTEYEYHDAILFDSVNRADVLIITRAKVKVVIEGEKRKVIINEEVVAISLEGGMKVGVCYVDEEIDGSVDYYHYMETEYVSEQIINELEYKNGRVYTNENKEWMDASMAVWGLFQSDYQMSITIILTDLKKKYK